MDIHHNARLTPFSREALAQIVLAQQVSSKSVPRRPVSGCAVISAKAAAVFAIVLRAHSTPPVVAIPTWWFGWRRHVSSVGLESASPWLPDSVAPASIGTTY